MELFELTKALVNLESVTGNERACAEFIADYLRKRKFEVELQTVEGDRANVFACDAEPEIVLSTHMDTVPPFFAASEDAEFIYGRGACDAKGIIAAQITAAEKLRAEGIHNFGLMFLVGEEAVSDGARWANQNPRGSRYMINGEPTENKLVLATKGFLRVDIRAHGRTAHSAYPDLGDSAIEKLLDVLAEFRRLPLPEDPLLGRTTMNIGVISGGRAANVIPDEAEAQVVFRTVAMGSAAVDFRMQIEKLLSGRCDFTLIRDTLPMRMEKLDGFETGVVAFTTDLPNLTAWGRPLLLGPGSISVAHTDHERVAKADLLRAVGLYSRMVRQLEKK
jgi:acetylornithine deacetylase